VPAMPSVDTSPSYMSTLGRVALRSSGERCDSEGLRQAVLSANADGMILLRNGQPKLAFEQLKCAEAVLAANSEAAACDTELLAITCSNLGVAYKKAGQPRTALRYLNRAMKFEERTPVDTVLDSSSLAITKMNACAALSSVGRHEEAEELVNIAVQLLMRPEEETETVARERSALLAVACHNLGAEREHLGCWSQAATAYWQGAEVSRNVLGPQDALTLRLSELCGIVLGKIERHPTAPSRPRRRRRPHVKPAVQRPTTSRRQPTPLHLIEAAASLMDGSGDGLHNNEGALETRDSLSEQGSPCNSFQQVQERQRRTASEPRTKLPSHKQSTLPSSRSRLNAAISGTLSGHSSQHHLGTEPTHDRYTMWNDTPECYVAER